MQLSTQQEIRILHVDDNPSITDLTGTFLEREDDQFAVETATSTKEGLQRISDRPPDCIVSDYDMPGMDGLKFLQTVREESPDLPFILFTGKGSETVASDAIAADVTDYLQKGSGTEQYELLANRIRNAVQANRDARRVDRQKQLMRLTEFTGDTGGFEVDLDSRDLLLTDGTRRLVGVSEDAHLCLEEAIELYHPDDQADVRQTLDRAVETGEQTRGTYRLQTLDGDERLVDVRVAPATGNSDVTTLRGAIRDITERREHVREVISKQQFIEQALNALDDLFYVINTDGTLRRWNDRLSEVTGYTDNELTEMDATELFSEDDREMIADAIETTLSDGQATVEAHVQTADGECPPYEFTGAQLTDANGNTTGLVGIGRNLTREKTREYRTLAEEYEALLETSGDAIFMLDVDTTGEDQDPAFEFARLSRSYETQTGISTEEVQGKTPQAVFGSERGAELKANYTRCVEQRGPISYREELTIAEDARIWETRLAPVIIDGDVIRIVGIARNMTEQVEREREMHRQNERLEEFAGIISHDLRSPLSVAEGCLELAQETCESDHLPRAVDAINRSQALIDDLLILARQDENVAEVHPIALTDIAQRSWQTVDTKQATLEFTFDAKATIEADQSRFRELFENLYRNAIEHGGNDVTVSVGTMNEGFYVADTGPGIPPSDREDVFEAGYSTSEDGTGFGLRIVEQIADAHGWEITVTESENGEGGARFEFTSKLDSDRDAPCILHGSQNSPLS